MTSLSDLQVKIFADGADKNGILELYANPLIKGMTTNPTLMRKAAISDYEAFAHDVLATVRWKPISFEVFADEFPEMRRQALKIRDWQENVYVKIPIMSPKGESSVALIEDLIQEGVKVNVTAVLTEQQCERVTRVLRRDVPCVVSVFAGRIADTGRNPIPIVMSIRKMLSGLPNAEVLWASVREVLNIYQAAESGCDIVTVPHDILRKAIELCGKNLDDLALDTVRMFDRDAKAAGYTFAQSVPGQTTSSMASAAA